MCITVLRSYWRIPSFRIKHLKQQEDPYYSCFLHKGIFCQTSTNTVGSNPSALPHVCYYDSCCWNYCSTSVVHSRPSYSILSLCWQNTFISRNLENMAKARTSLASVCRMDILFSGDPVVLLTLRWLLLVLVLHNVLMLMIGMISSYQLGSGEAKILSRRTINDGRWHKVTAVR